MLGKIDYTSSVSGGGYFTSFYGRLFTRTKGKGADGKDIDGLKDLDEVAQILAPNETDPHGGPASAWKRRVFVWLRENGRYLAPNGAGGLLYDLAVVLRNWLSLQVVIASFILMLFIAAQLIRMAILPSSAGTAWSGYCGWSPYTFVAPAIFVLLAMPLGWSYWLIGSLRANRPGSRREWPWAWFLPVFVAVALLASQFVLPNLPDSAQWVTWLGGLIAFLAIIFALLSWGWARHRVPAAEGGASDADRINVFDKATNWLTSILKNVLTVAFGFLAFAIIDSLGQEAYLKGLSWRWVVPLLGPAAAIAPFVKWLVADLAGGTNTRHLKLPLGLLAGVGAAVIILPVLIVLDFTSHAVANNFELPAAPPAVNQSASSLQGKIEASDGKIGRVYAVYRQQI